MTSKYSTFKYQWQHAQQTLENMIADQSHNQLMAGCDPNASDINTAILGPGGNEAKGGNPKVMEKSKTKNHSPTNNGKNNTSDIKTSLALATSKAKHVISMTTARSASTITTHKRSPKQS